MSVDNTNIYCPKCGKKFSYQIGHEYLYTTTSGSSSVNDKYLIGNEKQNPNQKILHCPYCGTQFLIEL